MKYRSSGRMAVLASTLLASASTVALAGEVTSDRLMNADKEPQNWLMVNKDYSSHRYSELDQINKTTSRTFTSLSRSRSAAHSGVGASPAGRPSKSRLSSTTAGCMSSTAFGAVYKIDVRDPADGQNRLDDGSGCRQGRRLVGLEPRRDAVQELRHFRHRRPQSHWTKADTGELVKTVQFDDPKTSLATLTSAPLVVGDKLIVGGSGGDRGARAHIDAFNADTGAAAVADLHRPSARRAGERDLEGQEQCLASTAADLTGRPAPTTRTTKLTIWGTGQPVPDVRSGIPPG